MTVRPKEERCHQQVRVVIGSSICRVDRDLREAIETRVKTVFRRFSRRISEVRVWLDDLNGPRGGVDRMCRIEVQLIAGGTATATSRAQTFCVALANALERAKRAIDRLLKRRRTRARFARRPRGHRDHCVGATSDTRPLDLLIQDFFLLTNNVMHEPGD